MTVSGIINLVWCFLLVLLPVGWQVGFLKPKKFYNLRVVYPYNSQVVKMGLDSIFN